MGFRWRSGVKRDSTLNRNIVVLDEPDCRISGSYLDRVTQESNTLKQPIAQISILSETPVNERIVL